MDTGERLAAYLSGDLDTDERTALEAELAGDPALRAHLGRIRAADTTLADLGDVDLPEGFSARLRARIAPEVDAVVGDQLSARRARRRTSTWLPALGAAAALAVVVAGGVTLAGGMGGSDDGVTTTAQDESARTMTGDGDARGGDAGAVGPDDAAATGSPAAVTGPVVTARGRTLDLEELRQLATHPDVQATANADAVRGNPAAAAEDFTALLRAARDTSSAGAAEDTTAEQDADHGTESALTPEASRPAADRLRRDGVSDDDLDAVAGCLSVLSEGAAAPVVPLYVEVATDEDDNNVIVYVALAPDADDAYRRVEIWMVERDTCEPLQFIQQGT